jgi:hypothetical protein
MLTWPKPATQLAEPGHGSPTLRAGMGTSFAATVNAEHAGVSIQFVPPADLEWLETTFADFNRVHGYPAHIASDIQWAGSDTRAVPRYELTSRYRRDRRSQAMQRSLDALSRLAGSALRRMRRNRHADPGQPPSEP